MVSWVDVPADESTGNLITADDWNNYVLDNPKHLRENQQPDLTNKSGGSLAAGDVVIYDTSADNSVTTTTVPGDGFVAGVVMETIANDAAGRILIGGGVTTVNFTGTVIRGDYLETSGTVKLAQSAGWKRTGASFAFALEDGSGGTVTALILGSTQGQDGAESPSNLIYNGNFDLWSKGTSFTSATTPANNDDTYLLEGWNLISDGNDAVDVTQLTSSLPDGSRYGIQLEVETTNKQAGIVHFIEAQDAIPLRNKYVNLTFQYTPLVADIYCRAAILAWDSTADSVTSDVVSSWAATPTWATNWTAENTPANLPSTKGDVGLVVSAGTWYTCRIDNIYLDTASFNNLAVVLWISQTSLTIGHGAKFAQVQLSLGPQAAEFTPRPVSQEVQLAQRRYIKFTGDGSGNGPNISLHASAGSQIRGFWLPFPTQMRAAPTSTVAGTWNNGNCTGPSLSNESPEGAFFYVTSSGAGSVTTSPNGTDDYLEFDAEL